VDVVIAFLNPDVDVNGIYLVLSEYLSHKDKHTPPVIVRLRNLR
jgi:hypothetical protein